MYFAESPCVYKRYKTERRCAWISALTSFPNTSPHRTVKLSSEALTPVGAKWHYSGVSGKSLMSWNGDKKKSVLFFPLPKYKDDVTKDLKLGYDFYTYAK